MRVSVLCFTLKGLITAERICEGLTAGGDEARLSKKSRFFEDSVPCSTAEWTRQRFGDSNALVFVGACGIAVRSIAPLVRDKRLDPAVLVVDECGTHVISLLSGHLGGANALTRRIATVLGADPVITTATDLERKFAVDVFAAEQNCGIFPMTSAKVVSAALLRGEAVGLFSEFPLEGSLPEGLVLCDSEGRTPSGNRPEAGIAVTISEAFRQGNAPFEKTVCLVPKVVSLGIGCKKGVHREAVRGFADDFLKEAGVCPEALFVLASIDLKRDEPGLAELSRTLGIPFLTFSAAELLQAEGSFSSSAFVKSVTGVENVCERSAVWAAGNGRLLCGKRKGPGITCALAVKNRKLHFDDWGIGRELF